MITAARAALLVVPLVVGPLQDGGSSTGEVQVAPPPPPTASTTTTAKRTVEAGTETTAGTPLPRTGADAASIALAGIVLVGAGAAAVTVAPRRRHALLGRARTRSCGPARGHGQPPGRSKLSPRRGGHCHK